MFSFNKPKLILHGAHSRPLIIFVLWLWSACKPVLPRLEAPQIAHLLSCFTNSFSRSSKPNSEPSGFLIPLPLCILFLSMGVFLILLFLSDIVIFPFGDNLHLSAWLFSFALKSGSVRLSSFILCALAALVSGRCEWARQHVLHQ